ncbi:MULTISPECIES: hypothetical protein [unclassified Symbiopectobacterium]|uniref:hypothetical protein n=1 Tax=unclassified Symbiopectobacterium TaxID=2794573 RepID=UPI0022269C1F|nr:MULTISPECIES: hypothetical protein [unclassified Symbiopectobacterium]MCW2473427.1 hypothetical protein [Candidatus Symbiopectobacterium sp. NZEC151]MCW2482529.1 hypothetical protein [Candidatus Symbiopectobacterium sp. NZEC135]
MADIYYPHNYLPIPLQNGFGMKPVSPLLRTEMTSGRARQRRQYTSTPTQAGVTWSFKKDAQAQLFEAWYRDTINDGSAWFYMNLKTPKGVESYKCRFVDIYEGPILLSGKYWQYSATLELWERPILAPGWAEFPDLVVNSNIIDLALNREWPQ